jgi:nucleotidyltransferase/DNA polymerase involved in DNA repair
MNDDDIMNQLIGAIDPSKLNGGTLTWDPNAATVTTAVANGGISGGTFKTWVEDPLEKYAMNRFAVDHKVTAQELLKLQEVAPDYAKEIKDNIAKNLGRDIATKVSYTKKHDKDTDVHHFIGRVWVFSEEELKGILGIK